MEVVSLVRVENDWFVFSDTREAWSFYTEWRQYRDCELLAECPVDAAVYV